MINKISPSTNNRYSSLDKKVIISTAVAGAAAGAVNSAASLGKTMKATGMSLPDIIKTCGGKIKFLSKSTLIPMTIAGAVIGTAVSAFVSRISLKKDN